MKIKELTIGTDPSTAYTFPSVDGAASEVLTTDGAGGLTFAAAGGGLPTGTVTGQMLYWDGAAFDVTGAGPNNTILANPGSNEIKLINIPGTRETIITGGSGNQFYANYGGNEFRIAVSGSKTEIYSSTAEIDMLAATELSLIGDYTSSPTGLHLKDNNFFLNNSTSNTAASKTWIPGSGIVQWGNDSARWAFFPMGQKFISPTTGGIGDAQYYALGTQAIANSSTGSYATYSFKVYYENNTSNHNETLKIELSHDGTNIVDTDYAFLSVDGGAREFQYVTRYNGGNLEIGGYSTAVGANVRFNFICETAGGIFA